MNGDYIVGTIVATPLSHVRQGSDMSHELRSASKAERKTYLTVKTLTLRIFFSLIASFLSRATFSLPHTSRVIGAYCSPDPTHQKNSELPREFERRFRLTHGMDRQVRWRSQILRQTGRTSRNLSFPPPEPTLIRGTLSDPVSHVREGCGHNGAYDNLRSLYSLNMFFVF